MQPGNVLFECLYFGFLSPPSADMSGHLLVLGTRTGYDDDDVIVKSMVIYLAGNILCKSDLTIESDTRIETIAVLAISFLIWPVWNLFGNIHFQSYSKPFSKDVGRCLMIN